jgi:formylglycine-generating enzyme required for sulfatase activity
MEGREAARSICSDKPNTNNFIRYFFMPDFFHHSCTPARPMQLAFPRWPAMLILLALLLLALVAPAHAAPDKRVALLIGNARYNSGLPPLTNPPKDTAALEASLKKLNFSVQRITDGDQKAMGRAIKQFGTDAQDAQVAFFYYSGHGMQARDENYLIPISAHIETEAELDGEAINLRGVLRQIEDARPQNAVIVLDACRDNPVASKSKNASKGLSRVQSQPTNTLVVFAAQAGTTASDNGVFAKALASHITQPNVGMRVVFDNVGKAVRSASGNKQSIQRDDQLSEDIVLLASVGVVSNPNPNLTLNPTPTPTPLSVPVSTDPETALWNEVKASGSMEYLDIYLKKYPKGKYTELARLEQKKLLDVQRQQKEAADRAEWDKAKAAHTPQAYEAYLQAQPSGLFADLARVAMAQLQQQAAALARQRQEQAEREAIQAREAARLKREQEEREAREMRPGKVFKDCADCPEMVVIPAGTFTMGSSAAEQLLANAAGAKTVLTNLEGPQHAVNLSIFAAGRYAVTKGEFAAFVRARSYQTEAERRDGCSVIAGGKREQQADKNWRNVGFAQDDDHPVVCVSWNDAKAYTQWLNQTSGKQYRLLSESEREYAARGNTRTAFWWGNSISTSQANYAGNHSYNNSPIGTIRQFTVPVGSFQPNPFGLYNVHGNVWEWVEDVLHENYAGAPTDGSAWTTGGYQTLRVVRGGSWDSMPVGLRSAYRYWGGPAEGFMNVSNTLGFRIARTVP